MTLVTKTDYDQWNLASSSKNDKLWGKIGEKIVGSGDVPATAAEVIAQYGPEVKGMKSSCGIMVGEISDHAAKRIAQRGVALSVFKDLIENAPITYPGNKPGTMCQQKGNFRLVIANNDGTIVSAVVPDLFRYHLPKPLYSGISRKRWYHNFVTTVVKKPKRFNGS